MNPQDLKLKDISIVDIQAKKIKSNKGNIKTQIRLNLANNEDSTNDPLDFMAILIIELYCQYEEEKNDEIVLSVSVQGNFEAPLKYKDEIYNVEFANLISLHIYPYTRSIVQPIVDDLLKRNLKLPLCFYVDKLIDEE